MTELEALDEAIRRKGSQGNLADAIGVTQQSISYWRKTLKKAPAEFVPKIERATGVPKRKLRPDIFGQGAAA